MANDPKSNPGGDGETIGAQAASGGLKTGHVRWMLAIGTALAIGGLMIVWLMSHA